MFNYFLENFISGSEKHWIPQSSALIVLESLLRPMKSQSVRWLDHRVVFGTRPSIKNQIGMWIPLHVWLPGKQREVGKDHRSALQCPGIRPTLSSRSKDLRHMYLSHRGKNSGMTIGNRVQTVPAELGSSTCRRIAEISTILCPAQGNLPSSCTLSGLLRYYGWLGNANFGLFELHALATHIILHVIVPEATKT
jgi:hypothetical protein